LIEKARIIAASPGSITALRADDLRDDPAAVDIARQHHRHVRRARESHIGDVAGAQIDLGRAAGAFDQHQIMARRRGG
jgi:hypothetical protein